MNNEPPAVVVGNRYTFLHYLVLHCISIMLRSISCEAYYSIIYICYVHIWIHGCTYVAINVYMSSCIHTNTYDTVPRFQIHKRIFKYIQAYKHTHTHIYIQ